MALTGLGLGGMTVRGMRYGDSRAVRHPPLFRPRVIKVATSVLRSSTNIYPRGLFGRYPTRQWVFPMLYLEYS